MIVHRPLMHGTFLQRNLDQPVSIDILRVQTELVQGADHHLLYACVVGHSNLSVSVVDARQNDRSVSNSIW